MPEKRNIGILFGGRSCEHEVSVTSARSVLQAIDRDRYDVCLIGIDKLGYWHSATDIDLLTSDGEVLPLTGNAGNPADRDIVSLETHYQGNLVPLGPASGSPPAIDVLFPVLHGTFGEDGTIQGLFEMAGIPYVGCGVAASAIAMDKAIAKQAFEAAGIPQAPSMVLHHRQWEAGSEDALDQVQEKFGMPVFTKPANLGSSVGVGKAHNRDELRACIEDALQYDNKIILERSMEHCQEVECAVLGNESPEASVVGEIIPGAEFYDYRTKYIDDRSRTLIPADISAESAERVRALSLAAFHAIDGSGLARVDFFVERDSREVFLNEINTLPGFTPISMYPKLWQASGIAYPQLIDRLVELALERHAARARLKRAF
jgi:D-alanine-D-alanine ligase